MLSNDSISTLPAQTLADFTRQDLIVPELSERDTPGVVEELSQILHRRGCIPDLLAFYHAALNHEFLINSATESGIALPHARLHGVVHSCFAFGRSSKPIVWGSKFSRPVQMVFLMAVPATDATGFLQLLSAIAKLSQHGELLSTLRSQLSSEQLYDLLKRVTVRSR